MPQWLLSTSMLSDCAEVFSTQPCQAQMPSVRLKIAVVGTGGATGSDPPKRGSSSSARAAARHFIDAPGIGRARRASERAAERDHAAHALGHHLGELARIEAAEAPADERDFAAVWCRSSSRADRPSRPARPRAGRDCGPAASRSLYSPCCAGTRAAAASKRRRRSARAAPAPDGRRRAVRATTAAARRGKAPSSWMARPSRNISVLDGGRSVCAATDIVSPVQGRPLTSRQPPMDQ